MCFICFSFSEIVERSLDWGWSNLENWSRFSISPRKGLFPKCAHLAKIIVHRVKVKGHQLLDLFLTSDSGKKMGTLSLETFHKIEKAGGETSSLRIKILDPRRRWDQLFLPKLTKVDLEISTTSASPPSSTYSATKEEVVRYHMIMSKENQCCLWKKYRIRAQTKVSLVGC